MATYTYETDPFDNIARIRLMIGDTDILPTTDAQFSDEEIGAFLSMASNSLLLAASYALEAWASAITDSLTGEKIGDYSYTRKDAENKMKLAKKYRDEDASTPVFEWSEPDYTGGSAITSEDD